MTESAICPNNQPVAAKVAVKIRHRVKMNSVVSPLKRPRRIVVDKAMQPKHAENERPNEVLTGKGGFIDTKPKRNPFGRTLDEDFRSTQFRTLFRKEPRHSSMIGIDWAISPPCCKKIQVIFEYTNAIQPIPSIPTRLWPNNIHHGF